MFVRKASPGWFSMQHNGSTQRNRAALVTSHSTTVSGHYMGNGMFVSSIRHDENLAASQRIVTDQVHDCSRPRERCIPSRVLRVGWPLQTCYRQQVSIEIELVQWAVAVKLRVEWSFAAESRDLLLQGQFYAKAPCGKAPGHDREAKLLKPCALKKWFDVKVSWKLTVDDRKV